MSITPSSPLTDFPGIGEARAKKLAKLGLECCSDLLNYYPRDYEDRRHTFSIREAPTGLKVCIPAMVARRPQYTVLRRGLDIVKAAVVDQADTLQLTFFNQGYVSQTLLPGEEYIFYGVVEEQNGRRCMVNPIFERQDKRTFTGRIMPIYPLTAGISNHILANLVRQALDNTPAIRETLPEQIVQAQQLISAEDALRNVHFPADDQALADARRRLAFEELFYLSIGLSFLKSRRSSAGPGLMISKGPLEEFLSLLPFAPTDAQHRVMEECAADMASGTPMNRLVQGDVGSGKTAVAACAAFLAVRSGYQAALMAPTEVLAEQHARSLTELLSPAGVRVGLLTGSLKAAEKRKMQKALAEGEIDFVVGTHALISKAVTFQNLGLMVADEQHRFGVAQRAALASKGSTPHVLVMSATPIPRTLALMVYGDLDVSVIDQLPPGRTPIETYVIHEDKRQRMYNFVRKQVDLGRQVYIVCPAVEENPEAALPGQESSPLDLKAVTTYAQRLQRDIFPDLKVGLLHGRMKPAEKEAVMSAFSAGETHILVSTTVIEVGVDVPNAALMIVENADRFGLSQLHQLRGRVGRGQHQSYCVLMTSSHQPDTMHRLRTLASTTDGFKISEEDLKLRGPGDFFGNRQHGMPQTRVADLAGDMRVLAQAQEAARALLDEDPGLTKPENAPVLHRVRALFAETPDIFN